MKMMMQAAAMFVLLKVRDVLESISSSSAHKEKWLCSLGFKACCQRSERADTIVSMSAGEMLHFMGVISAAVINYSCALIIGLQLIKQKQKAIMVAKKHV